MSWSISKSGPAMQVAHQIEKDIEYMQKFLFNPGEKALQARVLALCVVACHESKYHQITIEANGHFDGQHQHVMLKIDGFNKTDVVNVNPESETVPAPAIVEHQEPAAVPEVPAKPTKPRKHR